MVFQILVLLPYVIKSSSRPRSSYSHSEADDSPRTTIHRCNAFKQETRREYFCFSVSGMTRSYTESLRGTRSAGIETAQSQRGVRQSTVQSQILHPVCQVVSDDQIKLNKKVMTWREPQLLLLIIKKITACTIKWNFKQVIKATNSMPTIFRGSKVFSYSVKAKKKFFRPKSRKRTENTHLVKSEAWDFGS